MAKVLIVEDDPLVTRMYQKALALEGFEVESAKDGEDGLQKVKDFLPDIIYLDIMMPKMNGIELLKKLKKDANFKKIPVIILSNLSGVKDAELAIEQGASSYLVKNENKPSDIAKHAKQLLTSDSTNDRK